ncbi:MAG: LPS export ABC transporter periplasmic protein LptC [Armatimonadota bacterium]
MSIKKDYIIYIIIIVLLIAAPFLFMLFSGKTSEGTKQNTEVATPSPAETSPSQQDSMEVSATKLKSLNNGKLEWTLDADSIDLDQETKTGFARNIRCEFFDENGNLYVKLNSPGAKINLNTNDMEFTGPVRASTVKGEYFEAEKLKFIGEKKMFLGSGAIKLTKGNSTVYGKKLVGIPSKKTIEIKDNVNATINLKDFE